MASEFGFDISHLYLRPVPFEAANQMSVFVTAALEDGSSVDRHVELKRFYQYENQTSRQILQTEPLITLSGAGSCQPTCL